MAKTKINDISDLVPKPAPTLSQQLAMLVGTVISWLFLIALGIGLVKLIIWLLTGQW